MKPKVNNNNGYIVAIAVLAIIIIMLVVSKNNKPYVDPTEIEHARLLKSADSAAAAEKKRLDSLYATPEGKMLRQKEIKDSTVKAIAILTQHKKDSITAAKNHAKYARIIKKLDCTEEDAKRVLDREVWIGMTYEMVVYERGLPDNINPSNYGRGEQYQACWMDWRPMCFYFGQDHVIRAYN